MATKETSNMVVKMGEDTTESRMKNMNQYNNKLQKRSKCLCLLFTLFLIILIPGNIMYIKNNFIDSSNENINNNDDNQDNCPESFIDIDSFNIKDLIINIGKKNNESINNYLADLIVDELLISLDAPGYSEKYNNNNNNNNNNNTRRLATAFYADNLGASLSSEIQITRNGQALVGVCVYAGNIVDAIKFTFADGWISQRYGGPGGSEHCYNVFPDCIRRGNVRAGAIIDALQFSSCDSDSGYYGGNGGNPYYWNLDECVTDIRLKTGKLGNIDVVSAIQFR